MLTPSERKQLVAELRRIQAEVPEVAIRRDLMTETIDAAQERVNEIERILATGAAVRTPSADLGE